MTRKTRDSGTFGTAHKLPSGRYRAMYYGPDGRRYTASTTFTSKHEARAWLALRQADIIRKAWEPPEAAASAAPKLTFAHYAEQWLTHRLVAGRPLKDRTRQHYRWLLDEHLLPAFGTKPLRSITSDDVREWNTGFGTDTPTVRAHAYGLLRTILATAASTGKIKFNPCVIRGAATTKRKHKIRPASLAEIEKLTQAMPEHQQAMILLASWCALRFGELTELRRRDVDLDADKQIGVIRIDRAVVRTEDGFQITTPKSDAGTRDVAIPTHLVPVIQEHLAAPCGPRTRRPAVPCPPRWPPGPVHALPALLRGA